MHSLEPAYLGSLRFTAEQAATLRRLGEHRGRETLFARQRPEVLTSLRDVALVESSESSNRLEGITAPRARVRDLVLKPAEPRDRSEQEIAGYRDALRLVHEAAAEMPFRVGVVRQLHETLYRYHPAEGGRWKMADNEIVERDDRGNVIRVRFRAVPAVRTPEAMEALVARHRDALTRGDHDPLVLLPLAILDFLCIHPFADGNGRVARLLTLLLLYHAGYEVGRFISLERIFEQSKESYYSTLESSSRGWHEGEHDWSPWASYFWGVLLRAYAEFEERIGRIQVGRGTKTARVRAAALRRTTPFGIAELEVDCPGVARDTIRKALRALRDEGLVRAEGTGRGARWRVVAP